MGNGFKVVEDRYYRGNGRWAKVSRLHDKVGDRWERKYVVAFGHQGEVVALTTECYSRRYIAEYHAREYIKTGLKSI